MAGCLNLHSSSFATRTGLPGAFAMQFCSFFVHPLCLRVLVAIGLVILPRNHKSTKKHQSTWIIFSIIPPSLGLVCNEDACIHGICNALTLCCYRRSSIARAAIFNPFRVDVFSASGTTGFTGGCSYWSSSGFLYQTRPTLSVVCNYAYISITNYLFPVNYPIQQNF